MRKEELLIGTREEFEDYFYNKIGVIKFGDIHTPEAIMKMEGGNDYYKEISDPLSISNQLITAIKSGGHSKIVYFKYEYDKNLLKPTMNIIVTSHHIWIQDEIIEEEI